MKLIPSPCAAALAVGLSLTAWSDPYPYPEHFHESGAFTLHQQLPDSTTIHTHSGDFTMSSAVYYNGPQWLTWRITLDPNYPSVETPPWPWKWKEVENVSPGLLEIDVHIGHPLSVYDPEGPLSLTLSETFHHGNFSQRFATHLWINATYEYDGTDRFTVLATWEYTSDLAEALGTRPAIVPDTTPALLALTMSVVGLMGVAKFGSRGARATEPMAPDGLMGTRF